MKVTREFHIESAGIPHNSARLSAIMQEVAIESTILLVKRDLNMVEIFQKSPNVY